MVRTLISLPDKDIKKLDVLAHKAKKSRAQVVREAITAHLQKNEQQSWKEIVAKCAGMWKHKNIDSDEYIRQLRSEWDRDWDKLK
jgi:metal-responsive CopG/Arc/MetJ family transcriptional regulator